MVDCDLAYTVTRVRQAGAVEAHTAQIERAKLNVGLF